MALIVVTRTVTKCVSVILVERRSSTRGVIGGSMLERESALHRRIN
jgi:hypothetical protein